MKYTLHNIIIFPIISCCLVWLVTPQSCTSHTAGYTGQNTLQQLSEDGDPGLYVYLNNVAANGAVCNGTVYAWSYCFYPRESNLEVQMVFGAYQYDSNVKQFFMRPESYSHFILTRQDNSFTCGTVQLPPEKYFQIYSGDKVGACIRANKSINILSRSDGQTTAAWLGTCDKSNMSSSPVEPLEIPNTSFHLYANISESYICVYVYIFYYKSLMVSPLLYKLMYVKIAIFRTYNIILMSKNQLE